MVKTDGLAAGKGVVVTESLADARDAVRAYLSGEAFGDAGRTLVIEEGLTGPELSLLVVCNGDPDGALPLAPAQDFKRIGDGDAGPNTGGMGAYSPVPLVGDRRRRRPVMERAVRPDACTGSPTHGAEYRGVLYAGLMLTADGPEGDRVQRPLRRPGVPGRAARVSHPISPSSCTRPPRASRSTPTFSRRRVRRPWCSRPRATRRHPRTGDVITGLARRRRASNSVTMFHAGTGCGDDDVP